MAALADTERFWRNWAGGCRETGEWSPLVRRSLTAGSKVRHGIGRQRDDLRERRGDRLGPRGIAHRTERAVGIVDDDRAPFGEVAADDGCPDGDALEKLVRCRQTLVLGPRLVGHRTDIGRRDALQELEAGKEFADVVARYSDEDGAATRAGSIGSITADQGDRRFTAAAFALEVNQVSHVVESNFGFHVILRTE